MADKTWKSSPVPVNVPSEEQYHEKIPITDDTVQGSTSDSVVSKDLATSLEAQDEYLYPEGGIRAWLVVFGSFCAMFGSLGIANTLASFQAYISMNQLSNYSPEQIGWIFSLYTFLSFACGIYIGPLFDVYGPRWLLVPGGVCVVVSMFLLGVCTSKMPFAKPQFLTTNAE